MNKQSFLLLLAVTSNIAAGCGSSNVGATGPTPQQACADLATALCAQLSSCAIDAVPIRFGDDATCKAREAASCANSLAAASTGATPASVEGCAQTLPTVSCPDLVNNTLPAACQAQVGKVAVDGACAFNAQCGTQFCAVDRNTNCGVCATQPKAGDSCVNLGSCGPGLKCVNGNTTCAAAGTTAGEACDKDNPCGAGFSCVGSKTATMTMGMCETAVATAVAACDPKRQTSAGCDQNAGLTCDPTSKTCVALQLADFGATCDNAVTVCKAGATCVIPTGANAGTCIAAPADSQPCDTASGPSCLNLSRCIASGTGTVGVCMLPVDSCK